MAVPAGWKHAAFLGAALAVSAGVCPHAAAQDPLAQPSQQSRSEAHSKRDPSARTLVRRARRLAAQGDYGSAWMLVEQAVARRPNDSKLRALADAYQRRGMEQLKAFRGVPPGTAAKPVLELPEITVEDRRALAPPIRLAPGPGRFSFDLRGGSRALIEQVMQKYGIAVVYDSEFPESEPLSQLRLDNADWTEAIYALQVLTNSFFVAVSPKVAIFAKETAVKRADIEPNVAVSIPLPDTMTAADLTDVSNALRQAFGLSKVSVDTAHHSLVLRDRLSRVGPAVIVARQLMSAPAEVFVESELLGIGDTSDLSRGLQLQTSFPIVDFGRALFFAAGGPLIPAGFTNFLGFGGGHSSIGVGLADSQLFASLSTTASRLVSRASIRATSGQSATIHVGDRYPIIQQQYVGSSVNSTSYVPPPQITFEDLGLVVKVTPRVHDATSLTLDLDAEYKVLSGSTLDGMPVISNRKFTTSLRMRFGQSAVIAGLVQDSLAKTDNGLPLLNWIPWLHKETLSRTSQRFLLVLRPSLIRLPPSEYPARPIWTGTEVRSVPLDFYDRATPQP